MECMFTFVKCSASFLFIFIFAFHLYELLVKKMWPRSSPRPHLRCFGTSLRQITHFAKCKYNIFAIDGSRITLPNSKSNFEKYGEMFSLYNPKRRWTMALCSTIYDVCNDFISHGILTRYLSGERELAL